jgi:putative endonuclease
VRRQASGHDAEERACDYLQTRGLRLLERNYRCRQGEIDLVMEDGESLVFVEVRLRRNPNFGGALMSVDFAKRRRLTACAQQYLQHLPRPRAARFDVIAIDAGEDIQWIRNAFEAD